ncbi:hypothetical protein F5887DRAFT_1077006 [Amanita rubescens]|nr:hypothetical protein F5887DRAFT_1077006 [Amanita rubescens]
MAFFDDHTQDYEPESPVLNELEAPALNGNFSQQPYTVYNANIPVFSAESQYCNVYNNANPVFSNNNFPHFPYTTSGLPTAVPLNTDRSHMAGATAPAMNAMPSAAQNPSRPAAPQSPEYMQLQMDYMMLRRQMQAMQAQLAQQNNINLNHTNQNSYMNQQNAQQDMKPNVSGFPTHPATSHTAFFQKRAEFIKLMFPNAEKKIEYLKGQHKDVKFWTRESWNEWFSKQPRSKGRVKGEIPKHYRFLEDDGGNLIDYVIYSNICKYLRETMRETKKHMEILLAESWGNVDKELKEAIMNEMTNHFPFFAYCASGWKVHTLLSKWYSHWRGKRRNAESKKKQGDDGGDSGDEEDEEEILGDGSLADNGNASMAIDGASPSHGAASLSNKVTTTASRKHPRQAETNSLTPAKKAKKAINPIRSKGKRVVTTAGSAPPVNSSSLATPGESSPATPSESPPATPSESPPATDAPPTAPSRPKPRAISKSTPQSEPRTNDLPAGGEPESNNVPQVQVQSDDISTLGETLPGADELQVSDAPGADGADASMTGAEPQADDTPPADEEPSTRQGEEPSTGQGEEPEANNGPSSTGPSIDEPGDAPRALSLNPAEPPTAGFSLDVPFNPLGLKALALAASTVAAEGLGKVDPGPRSSTSKSKAAKKANASKGKLRVPPNSFSARNMCAREWLESNPDGSAQSFKEYWNSLGDDGQAGWVVKELKLKKTKKGKKKGEEEQ